MSSAKPAGEAPPPPSSDPVQIPDVLSLMWWLFVQPLRLRALMRAVGLEPDLSPAQFRAELAEPRDPRVRRLLTRLVLVPVPCLTLGLMVASVTLWWFAGFDWLGMAAGLVMGGLVGGVAVLAVSPLRGLALAATLPTVLGLLLATGRPALDGVVDGGWAVLVGLTLGTMAVLMDSARRCTASSSLRRRGADVVGLVAIGGVLGALEIGPSTGPVPAGALVFVLVAVLTYVVGVLHLPFYLLASASSLLESKTRSTSQQQAAAKVKRLLFLRHDMLPFALPGMESILVDVARADPELGRRLIARAADTAGQAEAAEHALNELRARALSTVAGQRDFDRLLRGEVPFLSANESVWLGPFFTAARDLQAAKASRLHHNRGQRLQAALGTLRREEERVVGIASVMPREHHQRLRVVSAWIEVVRTELDQLERDRRDNPQVPTPFVAGPVLREEDRGVFKGRRELVAKIEHFMARERRGTMLLLGQRRMGKSSLINMLPRLLGTGTRLLRLSFQGLSGEEHRSHPHLIVAEALDKTLRADISRPTATAWSHTLDWMVELDRWLQEHPRQQQVLVAIDEVERIEDGIREGWTDTSFLDFLRAAGDRLDTLRILMISAHPLHRIGAHWSDRLISVITIGVDYLEEDEARALCCPLDPEVFDFQALYPPGGIDRIVHETHRHPYLIQLVCDELCRQLNEEGRLQATGDDIEQAFDRALNKAKLLFRQLWQVRNDEERKLLSRLAHKPRSLPPSEARSWLKDEGYIREAQVGFAVTVPMFARWIEEHMGDS